MNPLSLQNKTVLIAGGAKNLGGLLAQDFAKQGAAAVIVHYHSDSAKADAEATAAAIVAAGAKASLIQADLTTAAATAALFKQALTVTGQLDIAINTTGMVLKKPMLDVTEADYDQMFAINAKAAFFFLQQAGQHLSDNGRICTLATSLLGAYTPFYSVYAGAKAALEHFTRAASKEFGSRGISVTAVAPGPMDTPFFYGQETAEAVAYHRTAAALSKFSPTGLTHIEDIVPLIRFLVTEGWWITGQTILANGGYTTK